MKSLRRWAIVALAATLLPVLGVERSLAQGRRGGARGSLWRGSARHVKMAWGNGHFLGHNGEFTDGELAMMSDYGPPG